MSPEMDEGSGYTSKIDVWSLGLVFYELATLKNNPFEE